MRTAFLVLIAVTATLSFPAGATELALQIIETTGPRTVDLPMGFTEQRSIDFGRISSFGPEPTTGRRFTLPDGSAHFVTTVHLRVVVASDGMAASPPHPAKMSSEGRRLIAPSPGVDSPRVLGSMPVRRALYAFLELPLADSGGVRIAPAGADWSRGPDVGVLLTPGETLVADHVSAGDVLSFDLSLYTPPTVSGHRSVEVRFALR